MKVSLNWLKEYVEIDLPASELTERLTHTGFNLEEMEERGGDVMIDLEVTSNRPDCLGHLGVAREIAAILGRELKYPAVESRETGKPAPEQTSVKVVAPDLCPRYIARIINHVKIGPSPKWMVDRLETIGIRAINNVVDITNYVMMECGQPLHAFDLDKLSGRQIIVRQARPQEPFIAIDHSEHKLDRETLVIADAERAVALAGVMGGFNSEVSDQTRHILLESAEFEPVSIRRTARKLNLHSDSSYRFERKIDPVGTEWASRRAAALIAQLAEGQLAPGAVDVWAHPFKPAAVTVKFDHVKAVLGINVDPAVATRILTSLGFTVDRTDVEQLVVTVPSFRAEVTRPIDLIEEIGRIHGFNKIPLRDTINIAAVPPSKAERQARIVHEALNAAGYSEAITVSLMELKYANLFTDVPAENVLRIADARRQVNDALRCSLVPSLLLARRLNQDAGNAASDLYEIARVYPPGDRGKLPREQRHLAILSSAADPRSLRGTLELMLRRLNIAEKITLVPKPMEWFLPDQSAQILLGGRAIGILGTIGPAMQKTFDLKKSAAVAEINFDVIAAQPLNPVAVTPLPKFPAIERDLSIIVGEEITWDRIRTVIADLAVPDLETVEFGELFRGKQIPKGQKSLFFTLRYRNPGRSLTHEEVDAYQQKVIEALAQACRAQLRTV